LVVSARNPRAVPRLLRDLLAKSSRTEMRHRNPDSQERRFLSGSAGREAVARPATSKVRKRDVNRQGEMAAEGAKSARGNLKALRALRLHALFGSAHEHCRIAV
jgi:hypothetical protein